jgi:hypothetical protein
MARSRNIKPSFFLNEELADLPYEARLLFVGLWTLADREGRLEDKPKKIKIQLFPYNDINCDDLLQRLHDKKFIIRYKSGTSLVLASGEGGYIQIVNFAKHQNPHHKEKDSVIPAFSECLGQSSDKPQTCPKPAVLIPDSLNLIPDIPKPETKNKKISPSVKKEKIQYAEFVSMTEKEYDSLSAQFGEEAAKAMIKILDDYKGANPKKRTYASDFRAIHSWVVKRYQQDTSAEKPVWKEKW